MTIDWKAPLPYDHAGRWQKKMNSIMNPQSKVTWPQLIAEFVIYWRTIFLKDYSDIKFGPDWYKSCVKQVRDLNQQAAVICNYFPHPDDEPLVIVAVKNYFRKRKPLKMGQFRKVRVAKKGNREVINITQDEQDIVQGIAEELQRLIKQRDSFLSVSPTVIERDPNAIKFNTATPKSRKKATLAELMELEKNVNTNTQ